MHCSCTQQGLCSPACLNLRSLRRHRARCRYNRIVRQECRLHRKHRTHPTSNNRRRRGSHPDQSCKLRSPYNPRKTQIHSCHCRRWPLDRSCTLQGLCNLRMTLFRKSRRPQWLWGRSCKPPRRCNRRRHTSHRHLSLQRRSSLLRQWCNQEFRCNRGHRLRPCPHQWQHLPHIPDNSHQECHMSRRQSSRCCRSCMQKRPCNPHTK